jgi:hypothetical protein
MNRNGKHTAEFLPEVIDGLRKKGFTLVTVGEMLKNKTTAQVNLLSADGADGRR